ncbi:MAG: PIG-L family deacetylase [Acidobacteria bacterium]|nr:PIG-L family deacetylase [Acidobacteriota bacterium]
MKRRNFMTRFAAASGIVIAGIEVLAQQPSASGVVIERPRAGTPHAGKVLAAIQPHSDDIPLFAAGTVAKLIQEGYTGHLIRVTNDDMGDLLGLGERGTIGQHVLANERDNREVARVLGLQRVFDLNYSNHRMSGASQLELQARLIFLFRFLKVDTVICYDPWSRDEENPDHYVTAHCVEAACWMAGREHDYPEHLAAGLQLQTVREKYYFGRNLTTIPVNRVVDISGTIEQKIAANRANKAKGPAGNRGSRLRAELASRNLRLPLLGDDDETADREYIREFVLKRDREVGLKYGLGYAEEFHYISQSPSSLEEYIKQHAVPLK